MHPSPKPDGFSLMELLITMVIIGILAVIATTVFWRAKDQGLEASMQSDLKSASIQQEHYFERNSRYAASLADLPNLTLSPGVALQITYAEANGWAAIATHNSLGRRCALLVGAAPNGSAPPADSPGVVECAAP
jgi:prepilin-type N-terminal cleavage/methylation domain-containing protein